jgi:3-oxoadipate enol-lactonase
MIEQVDDHVASSSALRLADIQTDELPVKAPAQKEDAMASVDPHSIVMHSAGNGAPLLLLHCLGVDRHFWDFAAGLASNFRLLSFDLPGHGETAVPAVGYSIEDLADLCADLLRREGVSRAHVAGISLGGLIAQRLAAAYPASVDRLVLIDTTPRYTDELRNMWAVRAKGAREGGVRSLIDGLLPIWFTPEAIAENAPAVRYVRETLARCPGEGYALACEALAAADLREDVKRIKAPTLVICGEEDIPSFLDAARWLAANIAGAKSAWIARARHASVLERPDDALQLLRDFLR